MISVTELRNGTKVEMDGGLWECLDYSHLKMGRGGAKVVTKFRNMESGSIVDRTFNSTEKLQDIYVEGKTMQYLYKDGDDYMFMDMETFEQVTLPPSLVGDSSKFMKENTEVEVAMYGDKALSITVQPGHSEDRGNRSRSARRHRLRRHQACQAGNRRHRSGAAVCRAGH